MNNKFKIFVSILTYTAICIFGCAIASQKIPRIVVNNAKNNKSAQSTLLAKGGAKIISAKQLKVSGVHKISQTLQAKSSIQLQDLYGDGSKVKVSMRGFGDNADGNTLIMLNGIPLVNSTLATPEFNEIPIGEIQQIEILPSSEGVLYGDQAVGGVINIVTKPPQKKQRHAAISIGSYDAQRYQVIFGDIFNNGFGYRIYANHYKTNNYRRHNQVQQNNIDALINYKFNFGKVYLQYQNINRHLQLPGYILRNQSDRRASQTNADFNNQQSHIFLAGLENYFNENWRFKLDSLFRKMDGKGSLSMMNIPHLFDERQNNFVLRPKIIGIINLRNISVFPVFGFDYLSGMYKYDGYKYYSKADQEEYAGYGQITVPIKNNIDLIVGGRAAGTENKSQTLIWGENKNDFGKDRAFISDANIVWHINSDAKFYLKRAGSYRFPKAGELALSDKQKMLQTQTGNSYEVGYQLANKKLRLLLNGYQLDLKNEILFIPDVTGVTLGKNVNLSPTVRRGLIINIDYFLNNNWDVLADYSFVNAKFNAGVNKGKQIPFVARNTLRIASSYQLDQHWNFYAEGIFIGSRYPAGDIKNWVGKLGGYTVYNANISYYYKPFTISLRCNNITNKYYYTYSTVAYFNNNATGYFYPAPDRNFSLTLSVDI